MYFELPKLIWVWVDDPTYTHGGWSLNKELKNAPYVRGDLYDALTKQRDELAAEAEAFANSVRKRESDFALKMGELESRAEKAEAERDQALAQSAAAAIDIREWEAKRLIDVSASLSAAISLLERGGRKAAASDKMFYQMLADYKASLERARTHLNSPPLSQDQQQALDAALAKEWDDGHAVGWTDRHRDDWGDITPNPHRKEKGGG